MKKLIAAMPLPPDLAGVIFEKAATAGISAAGVDIVAANVAVAENLQELAKAVAPDTGLATSFANSSVGTVGDDARRLIAQSDEYRKQSQMDAFLGAPQPNSSRIVRRPGHSNLSLGKGAIPLAAFMASEIHYPGQRASASWTKPNGITATVTPRGDDENDPAFRLGLRVLKSEIFHPARPVIEPIIAGVAVAPRPVSSSRNMAPVKSRLVTPGPAFAPESGWVN